MRGYQLHTVVMVLLSVMTDWLSKVSHPKTNGFRVCQWRVEQRATGEAKIENKILSKTSDAPPGCVISAVSEPEDLIINGSSLLGQSALTLSSNISGLWHSKLGGVQLGRWRQFTRPLRHCS